MTLGGLAVLLESTGLPVTYLAWPEKRAPELPHICYLAEGANPMFADGRVYYSYDDVRVELYIKLRDPVVEGEVETALAGFHWKKNAIYLDTEKCWMVTYDIEV